MAKREPRQTKREARGARLVDRTVRALAGNLRALVEQGLRQGFRGSGNGRLADMAVMVTACDNALDVRLVRRATMRAGDAAHPELEGAVLAAAADAGDRVPVVIRLPVEAVAAVGATAPIVGVGWFDYDAAVRGAN